MLQLSMVSVLLQLDGVKLEGEGGSMNVSAVALAAVDIAASVVDAALLNVQRTVAKSMQQPEVCTTHALGQLAFGWSPHFWQLMAVNADPGLRLVWCQFANHCHDIFYCCSTYLCITCTAS